MSSSYEKAVLKRVPGSFVTPRKPVRWTEDQARHVRRARPSAATDSARWLACYASETMQKMLMLGHPRTQVPVVLPDVSIVWGHIDAAISILQGRGYVVTRLTTLPTVLYFNATQVHE